MIRVVSPPHHRSPRTAAPTNTGSAAIAGLEVVSPTRRSEPNGHHHVHLSARRLRLGAARSHDQCVAQQRQRHLQRRPADRAQWLRTAVVRRAGHGRHVHRGADHLSRVPATATRWQWWRCATRCRSVASATAAAASPAGLGFTDAWAQAMADIGVRMQGALTASSISKQVADSAKQDVEQPHRRQPRRGSGAADAVPAGLPGRGQGAAGGADPVRHLAQRRFHLSIASLAQRDDAMIRISTATAFDTGISTLQSARAT